MSREDKCIYCKRRPKSSEDMNTCATCRSWMHRKLKQTSKQISDYADQQRTMIARLSAIVSIDGNKVERVDKQDLVNNGIVCFAGIKRRSASKVEQAKTRATAVIAQVRLRERRRRAQQAQQATA